MYCSQCGEELAPTARFCSTCGGEQEGAPPQAASDDGPDAEALLTLRPVFIAKLQVMAFFPLALFFSLWGGGFFGGFSMFALDAVGVDFPKWVPFVVCGILSATVLPLVSMVVNRKTYEKTTYTFYPDRLDYFEGFLTVEEKTIPLDRITEVNLRKGPFQSRYGLGTILLSTPATASANGRSGLRLVDIEHPDEVYAEVKSILDRSRSAGRLRAA